MRSLLIAAAGAAAFGVLLSAIPEDADARGSGKSARAQGDAAMTARTGKRRPVRVAAAGKMGGCGTYMYWKGGRCEDARNKK